MYIVRVNRSHQCSIETKSLSNTFDNTKKNKHNNKEKKQRTISYLTLCHWFFFSRIDWILLCFFALFIYNWIYIYWHLEGKNLVLLWNCLKYPKSMWFCTNFSSSTAIKSIFFMMMLSVHNDRNKNALS